MTLTISTEDLRGLLSNHEEVILCSEMLNDEVLDITEAINCFARADIENWLEDNAEEYGYKKNEDPD